MPLSVCLLNDVVILSSDFGRSTCTTLSLGSARFLGQNEFGTHKQIRGFLEAIRLSIPQRASEIYFRVY